MSHRRQGSVLHELLTMVQQAGATSPTQLDPAQEQILVNEASATLSSEDVALLNRLVRLAEVLQPSAQQADAGAPATTAAQLNGGAAMPVVDDDTGPGARGERRGASLPAEGSDDATKGEDGTMDVDDDDEEDEDDMGGAEDAMDAAGPGHHDGSDHSTADAQERPHSAVEKRYRSNINSKLQQLLALVPASGRFDPDGASGPTNGANPGAREPSFSRGVILDRVIAYIEHLLEVSNSYDAQTEAIRARARELYQLH